MDRELVKNENIQEDDEFEMLPMNPMWYNPMFMNMRGNMMGMMPIDHEYMSMMPMMPMINMEFERENTIDDEDFYNNNMNYDEEVNLVDYDEMINFDGTEMDYGNGFRKEKNNFNDKYDDNMFFDKNYKPENLSRVDFIVRKIERNNPGILNTMTSYGMPYPVAKRLIRRIVALTLNYC